MDLLDNGQVPGHPFVIGEVALGNLRPRNLILAALQNLPQAAIATNQEVLELIEQHLLHGTGIGYVDAHLLASVRLTLAQPYGHATSACKPLPRSWGWSGGIKAG